MIKKESNRKKSDKQKKRKVEETQNKKIKNKEQIFEESKAQNLKNKGQDIEIKGKSSEPISDKNGSVSSTVHNVHPMSRDMSIEGQISLETQIEEGILHLIEKEMYSDQQRYPHFRESRPQSLTFYEDENADKTDLTGQLQVLSPIDRTNRGKGDFEALKIHADVKGKGIRELGSKIYKTGGDLEIKGKMKVSKQKARDENSGRSKSRKYKGGKRDHSNKSKRDRSFHNSGYEPNSDIAVALEDLQDDVFEEPIQVHAYIEKSHPRNLPIASDKIYVQKNDRFQVTPRNEFLQNGATNFEINQPKGIRNFWNCTPVEIAIGVQKCWLPFANVCHGLLGGLALAHIITVLATNMYTSPFIEVFASFHQIYYSIFYFLTAICLVSVFDRFDVSHLDFNHIEDLLKYRLSFLVIPVYLLTMVLTLSATSRDEHIAKFHGNSTNQTVESIDISTWEWLSISRSLTAILGWCIVALSSSDDLLLYHLRSTMNYNTESIQIR